MKYVIQRIQQSFFISSLVVSFLCIILTLSIYFYHTKKLNHSHYKKDLLIKELKETTETIQELKIQTRHHDQTIVTLKHEKEELQAQHKDLHQENIQLKDDLSTLRASLDQSINDKNYFQTESQTLKEEKHALLEQIKTLESESFIKDTLKQKALLEIKRNENIIIHFHY